MSSITRYLSLLCTALLAIAALLSCTNTVSNLPLSGSNVAIAGYVGVIAAGEQKRYRLTITGSDMTAIVRDSLVSGSRVSLYVPEGPGRRFLLQGYIGASLVDSAVSTLSINGGSVVETVTFSSPDTVWYPVRITAVHGSVTASPASSRGYMFGTALHLKAKADPGYRFNRWSGDSASSADSLFFSIKAAFVDTAYFVLSPSSVLYLGNGNSGGTVPVDTGHYAIGDSVTILTADSALFKTDCRFGGWQRSSDTSGTCLLPGTKFPMGGADETLSAVWIPVYRLSYSANDATGGSAPTDTQRYAAGEIVTLAGNAGAIIRPGYTFTGWDTSSIFSLLTLDTAGSYTMKARATVLYAHWSSNSNSLTFAANGGTGTMLPQIIAAEASAKLEACAFSRPGYSFIGWNTAKDGSGSGYANGAGYLMGAEGDSLYAQWTAKTNTLGFNANGGNGTMGPLLIVTEGSVNLSPCLFSRSGWTFAGWNTRIDGTGASYADAASFVMDTANVTLFAQWTPVVHFLVFDANGGSGSTSTQSIGSGTQAAISLSTFIRSGYIFTGWNTESDGSGTGYADSGTYLMGTADDTLFAQWAAGTNQVIFNANGGSGTMVQQTILSDSSARLNSCTYSRPGYSFGGWNTQPSGSGTVYADTAVYTMSATSVTLYAQWTAKTFTVVFESNGGSGTMFPLSILTGTAASLSIGTFTRSGWTFSGWNTDAAGSGTGYADTATFIMGTADDTLHAQWNPNSYSLSFDPDGGSGNMGMLTLATGAADSLPACTYTRAGYAFAGWAGTPGGALTFADRALYTMDTAGGTLFARWTAQGNAITFYANGGIGSMSIQTIATGTAANLSACAFTRAGYDFAGWAISANGSMAYADGASYSMGASGIELHAKWTALVNTLVFDPNGGTGTLASLSLASDASGALPANTFDRTGYVFTGWNSTAAGTGTSYADAGSFVMGLADDTLFAQWMSSANTVAFNANGGSGSMANQTIVNGSSANLTASAFIRPGYVFAGWATSSTGAIIYLDGANCTMGATSLTLFAKWTPLTATLVFSANNGLGSMSDQSITYNATVPLHVNIYTRLGYVFAGWAETENGPLAYADSADYTMNDTLRDTLFARWTITQYSVIYNGNGSGAGYMANQAMNYGTSAALTACIYTRTGYNFSGWNTAANGSGTAYADGADITMGTAHVNLFAQWTTESYTISYLTNGGTAASNPASYTIETPTITPTAPTRSGYTFAGWYADVGLSTAMPTIAPGSSGDLSLYAKWTANTNTLSFDANGGSGSLAAMSIATDASANLTNNTTSITRAGANFNGWNTMADGSGTSYANSTSYTMGTGNVILYARWSFLSYTIGYTLNGSTNDTANPAMFTVTSPTITLAAATRSGYTFNGWYTEAAFTNLVTSIPAGSTGNRTLYAKLTLTPYALSYNPHGGTNGANPASYNITTATIILAPASRGGYSFAGWYTDSLFATTAVTQITLGSTGVRSFHAKWKESDSLVLIPAGTFTMGDASNPPAHSVTLSSFKMSNTECTQWEYLRVMGINPSYATTDLSRPVEGVTWFDAVLYCNARSKAEGKDTVYTYTGATGTPGVGNGCTALAGIAIDYSKAGYRLPTEAEWEYACRSGSTGDYYWATGGTATFAWYSLSSGNISHPIGLKTKNAFGLYDMVGNVWEWCADWYDVYSAAAQTDPTGPAGVARCARGGAFNNDALTLRSALRNSYGPDSEGAAQGFRVVLRL